jgi:hypothetical protein
VLSLEAVKVTPTYEKAIHGSAIGPRSERGIHRLQQRRVIIYSSGTREDKRASSSVIHFQIIGNTKPGKVCPAFFCLDPGCDAKFEFGISGGMTTLRRMKKMLLLSCAALILAGCDQSGNSSSGAASTRSNSSGSVFQAPADYVGALGKAKQNAGKTVDIATLKPAIDMFQVDKGHYPQNLDELVKEKYIKQLPQVPNGMKLDYNPATGEVKVVNQ